jgi:hypothetical protein
MYAPGFTAEASLYETSGRYQSGKHAINSYTQSISSIRAAEVIRVHSCPPGWSEIDDSCWPDPLEESGGSGTGGGGGGGGPHEDPDGGGGAGGGGNGGGGPHDPDGGGGEPTSVPPEIVAECTQVGGKYGKKYCGGPHGPSACKTCAQVICQQRKCEETGDCNPAELNGQKETFCDQGCPDTRECKNGLMVKGSTGTTGHGGVSGR